jgi:hypothetical protein
VTAGAFLVVKRWAVGDRIVTLRFPRPQPGQALEAFAVAIPKCPRLICWRTCTSKSPEQADREGPSCWRRSAPRCQLRGCLMLDIRQTETVQLRLIQQEGINS